MASKKRSDDDFDPNDFATGTAMVPAADVGAIVAATQDMTVDASRVTELLESGKASLEHVLILQVGKGVEGKLLGKGGDVLCNDPSNPTVKRPVGTWRVQVNPSVVAVIMDCAQLASRLPPLVGKNVCIVRMPPITQGSRRINQYVAMEIL